MGTINLGRLILGGIFAASLACAGSRASLFAELDRPALQPLPAEPSAAAETHLSARVTAAGDLFVRARIPYHVVPCADSRDLGRCETVWSVGPLALERRGRILSNISRDYRWCRL